MCTINPEKCIKNPYKSNIKSQKSEHNEMHYNL